MAVDVTALLADLGDETAVVDALLADQEAGIWTLSTPAEGWTVADQITHLAYFDDAAVLAAIDPDRFALEADVLMARGEDFAFSVAQELRATPVSELLPWFRRARSQFLETFASLEAETRLPWYGASMSAASSVTARLMETWAHGVDVADALGRTLPATGRLRHVAHLGVRTVGFAFGIRGLAPPDPSPYLELLAPDGSIWTWGDPTATNRVTGSAEDFCLVVTQRRHPDDTDLVAVGAGATAWLTIAQAYAGPPGKGRARAEDAPVARRGPWEI